MTDKYTPTEYLVLVSNTLEPVYTYGEGFYKQYIDKQGYLVRELVPNDDVLTREEALDKYPEYMI